MHEKRRKEYAGVTCNTADSVPTACGAGNAAQGVGVSERAESNDAETSYACGADFERLASWCEEVQGRPLSSCVQICGRTDGASKTTGFGSVQCDVRATRAVSRGEELLRISGDAVATAADLGAYAAGRDAIATDDDAELREIAALALLIQESRKERARSGM